MKLINLNAHHEDASRCTQCSDRSKLNYAAHWQWALLGSGLGPAVKVTGVAFSTYADYSTGENVFCSQVKLAAHLGCRRATVGDHIRELLSTGWLAEVENRALTGKPNIYRLTFPGKVRELGEPVPQPIEDLAR